MQLKFKMTKRDKKMALWVNGINIWDVKSRELTPDVLIAIKSAVMRGAELNCMEIQNTLRLCAPGISTLREPFEVETT